MKKWTALVFLLGGMIFIQSCSTSSRGGRDYTTNRNARSHYKKKPRTSDRNRTIASNKKRPTPKVEKKESRPSKAKTETAAVRSDRQKIVTFAKSHRGVAYKYGGKTPESGFDCSGLVYYAFKHYDHGMVAGSANQAKLGIRIPIKEAQPGDLLFFGNNQRVSHVGIVSFHDGKTLKMVHSSSSRGVVEDEIYSSTYWKSRFLYAKNVISDIPSSGRAQRP